MRPLRGDGTMWRTKDVQAAPSPPCSNALASLPFLFLAFTSVQYSSPSTTRDGALPSRRSRWAMMVCCEICSASPSRDTVSSCAAWIRSAVYDMMVADVACRSPRSWYASAACDRSSVVTISADTDLRACQLSGCVGAVVGVGVYTFCTMSSRHTLVTMSPSSLRSLEILRALAIQMMRRRLPRSRSDKEGDSLALTISCLMLSNFESLWLLLPRARLSTTPSMTRRTDAPLSSSRCRSR
ncbi:hypothetical protein B0T26DRAFT_735899 [Lasiosphaeria miniovina]|uniref:Uncharacterized protein n=1 Tax=Lasiosphaeria miniovina TaxID=1954250 RepID=A0AA40DJE3_9PEZI|nr:uncharacterized protein B0T26DRAFT_735899 [Lasiosphaeria miniovina]KAK0702108.1 hypothetical protein B0T26DRAFT_735899 [Lasiosphaeria miniovina]